MEVIRPGRRHVEGYLQALRSGWSPGTNHIGMDHDAIDRMASDPDRLLALTDDRDAAGGPVRQPDGSTVPRLPGLTRWMWDGEFAGSINLRWQPGTTDLPPTCLVHIGYAVVPWKRRRGYATAALAAMLPIAAGEGMPLIEITTEPANIASRRVAEANGAILVRQFTKPASAGGGPGCCFGWTRATAAPDSPPAPGRPLPSAAAHQ